MGNSLVSIILPVYNGEKYIENTIRTIQKQSYSNFELIVVDDGSSDASLDICNSLAKKDDRIAVYHQRNSGISAARNKGLSVAVGEFVFFSDHDDTFGEFLIEDNLNLIVEYNADIVKFGHRHIIEEDGVVIHRDDRPCADSLVCMSIEQINKKFYSYMNREVFTCVWDCAFRKKVLDENNLMFNEDYLFGNEDFEFMLKCLLHSHRVVLNPGVYYSHCIRLHHSVSSTFHIEQYYSTVDLLDKVQNYIVINNIDDQEGIRNLYLVRKHIVPLLTFMVNRRWKLSHNDRIKELKTVESKPLLRLENVKLSNFHTSLEWLYATLFNCRLLNMCLLVRRMDIICRHII